LKPLLEQGVRTKALFEEKGKIADLQKALRKRGFDVSIPTGMRNITCTALRFRNRMGEMRSAARSIGIWLPRWSIAN